MAVVELCLSAADAGYIGSPNWRVIAYGLGAFWQPLLSGDVATVFQGQAVTMFLTYAFLHGGLVHLALNCVVLLGLGKMIAGRVGPFRTMMILFLSAVGGAVAFGIISKSPAPMIGASGAVFGLLGVWQCWEYRVRKRRQMPVQPVLASVLGLILINIALTIFLSGALAWEAHLGGWVVGLVAAITFADINRAA